MQPYIVRRAPQNGAKVTHYITDQLHVSRVDEVRSTGRTMGGMFREVESTGRKVAGILRISTGRGAVAGYGDKRGHTDTIRTSPAAEIKKVVRRVRPEELDAIAECDVVIAGIEARLKEARAARAELVATAWAKAHVVTLKELEALADLPVTSTYGLTEEQKRDVAAAHDEIRALFQN